MGNENSKDGKGAGQPEAEGPSGSEKDDTQSKLPNGDVGTSSGKPDGTPDGAPDGPTPEGQESKETTDVDEHTKRMTIISENVYHYVGLVAGREYAREKGLAPKEGDLPVAPLGFLRPEKKKQDAKATDRRTVSEPGKPEETLEVDKEVDTSVMELPRFYQSPGEDKNKATEKSPDAPDGKAKDKVQEKVDKGKVDKGKVAKTESKPEKEVDSLEMELPSFYKLQATDKEKPPGESGKPTDVSSIKVENKSQKKDDKEKVNKKENLPEKDVDLKKMELPRFYQSDKNKAIAETGKSELPSVPNGKAEGKTEKKDKIVEKPSKGALESKPEKEVSTPATKIPRFHQLPNEDKKKAGKSEAKDVSNGMPEGKTLEKSGKVDKTADMELPRFYQSPSQDKIKTPGEPNKSETRNVPNGETKAAKADLKNDKLEKKPEKETKMQLPRFYSADNNEDKPETESDSTAKRFITALTVGPRSRNTEEPKMNVAKNFLTVRSTKNEENETEPVEQDVEERTIQNEKETSYKKANLESLDSEKDPEPIVTQSKSAVKKDKSVRFDDSVVETATPSTEKKRIISMMYVAPVRSTKNEETICYAAPVELTSAPPPTYAESIKANDEDYQANDEGYQANDEIYQANDEAYQANDGAYQHDLIIPMCGEALLQADKHSRGLHEDKDDIVNMTYDPEEVKKQPQDSDTTDIFNNYGKGPTMNYSEHDEPDAVEEIITPKAASSLYSSSMTPRRSHLQRSHDVQEGVPDYDVDHLKQPLPRSPEVDLGSGKILNAPSILMGSSITLSTNRQRCEVLPQETPNDGQTIAVIRKTKPAPKEVRIEPLRRVVSRQTGTAVSSEFSFESERASISDEVHASVEPLVLNSPDSVKSLCDSYTQTSEGEKTSAPPPVVRSRSVGFQCGPGNPKRSIATLKRPSLPSDSPPAKPLETEKKTRIPLAARPSHPETKRPAKGSPLPERKISVLRNDAPTTNKISPRTPPPINDPKSHKELVKRRSLPVQNSPGSCSGHPVATPKVAAAASPRVVRKKDVSPKGTPLHKTTAPSKSMDSIPRCTCLQLSGKDSPHADKTTTRHPSNPLGLREYDFSAPSKKPHWR